jgi:hypothetical protein
MATPIGPRTSSSESECVTSARAQLCVREGAEAAVRRARALAIR